MRHRDAFAQGGLAEHERHEAGAPRPRRAFIAIHVQTNPRAGVLTADFDGALFQVLPRVGYDEPAQGFVAYRYVGSSGPDRR
jgi:hypothetical protein